MAKALSFGSLAEMAKAKLRLGIKRKPDNENVQPYSSMAKAAVKAIY